MRSPMLYCFLILVSVPPQGCRLLGRKADDPAAAPDAPVSPAAPAVAEAPDAVDPVAPAPTAVAPAPTAAAAPVAPVSPATTAAAGAKWPVEATPPSPPPSPPAGTGQQGDRAASAPAGEPKAGIDSIARFDMQVPSIDRSASLFLRRVEASGGRLDNRENNTIRCRIPSERFGKVEAELPALGEVIERSTRTQTNAKLCEELDARIRQDEAYRGQLLASIEKAGSPESMDAVIKLAEIRRLNDEIETRKAEKSRLAEGIGFSTIEVRFQESPAGAREVDRTPRSRFDWINEIGPHAFGEKF